jgi:hypothetical protein
VTNPACHVCSTRCRTRKDKRAMIKRCMYIPRLSEGWYQVTVNTDDHSNKVGSYKTGFSKLYATSRAIGPREWPYWFHGQHRRTCPSTACARKRLNEGGRKLLGSRTVGRARRHHFLYRSWRQTKSFSKRARRTAVTGSTGRSGLAVGVSIGQSVLLKHDWYPQDSR